MVDEIRDLCKKHNTNVKVLEKELGFGNGTIRKWDEQSPSLERVLKVAKHFGVSISELTGEEQKENLTVKPGEVPNKLEDSDYFKLNNENRALIDSMIEKLLKSQSDE